MRGGAVPNVNVGIDGQSAHSRQQRCRFACSLDYPLRSPVIDCRRLRSSVDRCASLRRAARTATTVSMGCVVARDAISSAARSASAHGSSRIALRHALPTAVGAMRNRAAGLSWGLVPALAYRRYSGLTRVTFVSQEVFAVRTATCGLVPKCNQHRGAHCHCSVDDRGEDPGRLCAVADHEHQIAQRQEADGERTGADKSHRAYCRTVDLCLRPRHARRLRCRVRRARRTIGGVQRPRRSERRPARCMAETAWDDVADKADRRRSRSAVPQKKRTARAWWVWIAAV